MDDEEEISIDCRPLPVVKWQGGKSALVPEILDLIHRVPYKRYVDLFSGSLAIPLALQPDRLWINDINRPLIHTYRSIQHDLSDLEPILKEYNNPEWNTESHFYRIRSEYNKSKQERQLSLDVCAQFIYLNRRGFKGIYRENQRGEYNGTFGDSRGDIYDLDAIRDLSYWFRQKDIKWTSRSYRDCFDELVPGDLVYLDPPYYPKEGKSGFTSYWRDGFGLEDQEELADMVCRLDKRGIWFIESNTPCQEIRDLYRGFHQRSLCLKRQMRSGQGKTGNIEEDNEIIITNIL